MRSVKLNRGGEQAISVNEADDGFFFERRRLLTDGSLGNGGGGYMEWTEWDAFVAEVAEARARLRYKEQVEALVERLSEDHDNGRPNAEEDGRAG